MRKITRRSFLQIAGVSSTAALLAACGDTTSTSTATSSSVAPAGSTAPVEPNSNKTDETLKVIMESSPSVLTTLKVPSASEEISRAIGDALLRYNDETKTADPNLAESFDMIDDTHYRFHLRKDAKFYDGTPVKASDVLYSLSHYKAAGVQDLVPFDTDNFVVEDDYTIVIALVEYTLGWEFCLGQAKSIIVSEAAVEAAGGIDAEKLIPVTSGRYKVSEWSQGDYVLLERNEDHWNKDWVGYYKYIKFTATSDSAARTMAIRSGDADIANRITVADYMALQNDTAAYGFAYDCGIVNSVYFNCESGVCSDVKIREAICHAIDPESVNQVMNLGLAQTEQGLWPATFPYYKDCYDEPLYNPERAKELLAEAGCAEGLTVKCIVWGTFKEPATVIQESLRQVGVTLEVDAMDNATWTPLVRAGEYDITIGNTCIASVNATMLNHVDPRKIGSSAYHIRMDVPEIEEAIATLNSPIEENRVEGFEALFDFVFDNYTVCGLCGGDKYMAMKKGVVGLTVGSTYGFVDVTDCHVEA